MIVTKCNVSCSSLIQFLSMCTDNKAFANKQIIKASANIFKSMFTGKTSGHFTLPNFHN